MGLPRSEKWKRFMRARAKREARGRKRTKRRRKQRNRYEDHLTRSERTPNRRSIQHGPKFSDVVAPNILSFVKNPEGVSKFIYELEVCFRARKPVFVKLEDVSDIEYDGINVLLSVVILFKSHKIKFDGNYPSDDKVTQRLDDSGFFAYLYETKFKNKKEYNLTQSGTIQTHAKKKVDSKLGERLIDIASSFVWGNARRCLGVQRTFIELMQNTNNHASLEKTGEKHWWLSVQFDKSRNVACFSFVDYGVGVFENLSKKAEGNKFYRLLDTLRERVDYGQNPKILKLILHGELHKTASGKSYRGKGLPGIYQAYSSGSISNLAIVTNDVYFNSVGERFETLKTPFSGTFVYWELGGHNKNLPAI